MNILSIQQGVAQFHWTVTIKQPLSGISCNAYHERPSFSTQTLRVSQLVYRKFQQFSMTFCISHYLFLRVSLFPASSIIASISHLSISHEDSQIAYSPLVTSVTTIWYVIRIEHCSLLFSIVSIMQALSLCHSFSLHPILAMKKFPAWYG